MKLSGKALEFCAACESACGNLERYAERVAQFIKRSLEDQPCEIHLVSGRAKEAKSLLRKLRSKGYDDPAVDLTDLIGIRVITYYDDDVDRVVRLLRTFLTVDEERSVDKRKLLSAAEFGYQSVHLVALAPDPDPLGVAHPELARVVEVQVRSLLAHAWAETEHGIVYKSGIDFPIEAKRRMNAIAGSFHTLGHELVSLRDEQDQLVDRHRAAYENAIEGDAELDATRLAALLLVVASEGIGWEIDPSVAGRRYSLRGAALCVEALQQAGIRSGNALRTILETPRFIRLRDSFAAQSAITSLEVSHFALAVLAVATVDKIILNDFPDLLSDTVLAHVVAEVR
jgi:ppGpp synthetase/RelA/SpoT-type nucleotidyltranferase